MTFNYATYMGYIRKYNLKIYPRNTFNKETADIVIIHNGRSRLCGTDNYRVTKNKYSTEFSADEMALLISSGSVPHDYRWYKGAKADLYEFFTSEGSRKSAEDNNALKPRLLGNKLPQGEI